jgi:hypothetical protein
MGLFDFIADVGEKVFSTDKDAAEKIKKQIVAGFPGKVSNIDVKFDDGAVTLAGDCDCPRTRRLVALTAGNIAGVKSVNDDGLRVPAATADQPATAQPSPAAAPAAAAPAAEEEEGEFYTIQSGDTLSAIAKRHYGNAMAYKKIFEANKEVIKDPDKIYPGQKIFIPKG